MAPERKSQQKITASRTVLVDEAKELKRLSEMVARSPKSAKREPEFVFKLSDFEEWLASQGYSLGVIGRSYWQRLEGGLTRKPIYFKPRVHVGRPHSRWRGRHNVMGSLEAKSVLFEEFEYFVRTGGRRPLSKVDEAARVLKFRKVEKVARKKSSKVEFAKEAPASEGFIDQEKPNRVQGNLILPHDPSEFWRGGFRGKSKTEASEALVSFIRRVYGEFLPEHRSILRRYIFRADLKLYKAISEFESHSELPSDIALPTSQELVQERLKKAAEDGLDSLAGKKARRSVVNKLRKLHP